VKTQTGLRVDGFVFDGFKELCRRERMLVGEAVQRLMEACLKDGSVASVLRSEGWGGWGGMVCYGERR